MVSKIWVQSWLLRSLAVQSWSNSLAFPEAHFPRLE